MDEQERIAKQLTDFDDPDRGSDDERVESGEETIDESGRNPTQRAIDEELELPRTDEGGEAPGA